MMYILTFIFGSMVGVALTVLWICAVIMKEIRPNDKAPTKDEWKVM